MSWVPWTVQWSNHALKDLGKLSAEVRARVESAVREYAQTGQADIRKIKGEPGVFRMRVGDWRILFAARRPTRELLIHRIENRDHVYD